jgi:hypothetical protein
MSSSKRPSTSSLRRFISSRPYVPVAEIRRRFGLDDPDTISRIERDGEAAFVGLPDREALKLQDLWARGEVGLELSVEVHAPVVVGIYPMRIARYVVDGIGAAAGNGRPFLTNGVRPHGTPPRYTNGQRPAPDANGDRPGARQPVQASPPPHVAPPQRVQPPPAQAAPAPPGSPAET